MALQNMVSDNIIFCIMLYILLTLHWFKFFCKASAYYVYNKNIKSSLLLWVFRSK